MDNQTAVEKFQEEYEKEILELLVLIKSDVGGASVKGDMLMPSAEFMASMDIATGELSKEKGRLEWMIPKAKDRVGWGFELKKLTIYHVKVRKCKQSVLEPYMLKEMNNRFLLLEVLDSQVIHPVLDQMRKEKLKTIYIEDEVLGKFSLNRDYSWFEGEINWLGEKCSVSLGTDEEDGDSAEKAWTAFKQLYTNLKEWDQKVRYFAAKELTILANDWIMDSVEEGEEEPEDITKDEFMRRMRISELAVESDGGLTLYYNDDNMFWGHVILIEANISGKITSAHIAG
ncbi:DUF2262 domain-containing protein [Cellulosilyticum lentocellum]|uniref:Uncharacterized protein n=1 Tax=Cellulosilyticum lentocellum (strain ATCC 49066 / DSM 5427 / NCIMB 11756 / RHM5) TaxID=642492 RepID=F2JPL1_CELLD|nr:DUF2262 domain-containing protein [Cellulosilyticum lentocellum]ADZ83671.1 Protein of unknown function DUF2262 [Cellulosilyticum lentocellum DSM 5427]